MDEYRQVHKHPTNLLFHIVAVPMFIIANLGLLISILLFRPILAIFFIVIAIIAMAAQGKGHKLEQDRPKPFRSFGDFLKRFYVEQFYTFPKYVISGQFWQTYQGSKQTN